MVTTQVSTQAVMKAHGVKCSAISCRAQKSRLRLYPANEITYKIRPHTAAAVLLYGDFARCLSYSLTRSNIDSLLHTAVAFFVRHSNEIGQPIPSSMGILLSPQARINFNVMPPLKIRQWVHVLSLCPRGKNEPPLAASPPALAMHLPLSWIVGLPKEVISWQSSAPKPCFQSHY